MASQACTHTWFMVYLRPGVPPVLSCPVTPLKQICPGGQQCWLGTIGPDVISINTYMVHGISGWVSHLSCPTTTKANTPGRDVALAVALCTASLVTCVEKNVVLVVSVDRVLFTSDCRCLLHWQIVLVSYVEVALGLGSLLSYFFPDRRGKKSVLPEIAHCLGYLGLS